MGWLEGRMGSNGRARLEVLILAKTNRCSDNKKFRGPKGGKGVVLDGWMRVVENGWMDVVMDGWMDGVVDGWMDVMVEGLLSGR